MSQDTKNPQASTPKNQKFDLEERCLAFAKQCRDFIFSLPKGESREIYGKQLLRSSSSIGANYLEANDSLGSKDFVHRLRIARKEAKESIHWLRLFHQEPQNLIQECTELKNILSSIIQKYINN